MYRIIISTLFEILVKCATANIYKWFVSFDYYILMNVLSTLAVKCECMYKCALCARVYCFCILSSCVCVSNDSLLLFAPTLVTKY